MPVPVPPADHPARRAGRRLPGLAALVAAVALTAVACGTADPGTDGATPTTTAPGGGTSAPATGSPAATAPPGTSPAGGSHEAIPAARRVLTPTVDGLERRAIVRVPAIPAGASAPLVFVFHGHGGSGTTAERQYPVPDLWPEAIVVYPDGLPGHEGVTDPEGVKPGWQSRPGELGDRDLHLFDALLADLTATLPVDPDQVVVMGHSNGAQFSAVVWNQRGDALAAVAMSSAPAGRNLEGAPAVPLFLSMGRSDPVAPFAAQEAGIARAQAVLGVDAGAGTTVGNLITYPGPDGMELAVDVHDGGHELPDEVLPEIVSFLQRHRRG